METVTRLIDAALAALGPFVPRLVGALLILLAAWVGARVVRAAVLEGYAGLTSPAFEDALMRLVHGYQPARAQKR